MVSAILNRQSLEWLAAHRIYLHPRGRVRLRPGDRVEFLRGAEIEPYVGFYAGHGVCRCGSMSYSHSPVSPKIAIGRYCSISGGLAAHLHGHPLEHVSTSVFTHDTKSHLTQAFAADHGIPPLAHPNPQRPPVVIGHDVWIGQGATLLPGVEVATGAVIAAGSVVTRSVGPYEIVAGNPAKVVRRRFEDEIVAGLLESEWWDYHPRDLAGLGLDRPQIFLAEFDRAKPDLERYDPPRARMADMPRDA
jgi:acetyltransferase-like isoleucine patch superfamily enzyme